MTSQDVTTRDHDDQKQTANKKSSLSTIKIIASAGAAVTASVLTSMLTGYLNGVGIVAVTSIIIAVLSETYSKTLRRVKRVSAKLALQAIPLPDSSKNKLINAVEDTDETITDDESDNDIPPARIWDRFTRWIGQLSNTTKTIVMVMFIALLAIGVSWGVTTITDRPDITNVTQRVTKQEVVSLSSAEKTAIQEAAVNAVQSKINTLNTKIQTQQATIKDLSDQISKMSSTSSSSPSTSSASPSPTTDSSTTSTSPSTDDTTKDTVKTLQGQITSLESEVTALQTAVKALQSESSSTNSSNSNTSTGN